jgi:hypothetical protein
MELDLHIHTMHSFDSRNGVREIIKRARKLGLDGVAFVDHGGIGGGLEALALPEKERDGLVVIAGMEVMTSLGEILGLFLTEPIEAAEPLAVISEIKKQGGVAVLPHPYFSRFIEEPAMLTHFDAIESCNGRHQLEGGPDVDETQKQIEKIARQHNLAVVGGSDAHSYAEIGIATTVAPGQSAEDVKKAILARRTIVRHGESARFKEFFFEL